MTEEINEPQESKSEPDQIFEQMAEFAPSRDAEVSEDGGDDLDGHQTLEDRIENSPKLSDIQTIVKQLFPDLSKAVPAIPNVDVRHLNVLQVSRVLPEYYSPLKRIQIKDLVKRYHMPVAVAIALVEVAVGVPIDGEGRIDLIHVAGKGAVAEETKDKTLGLA